jgi:molybdopterin biosynthesis enzyme
MAAMEAARRAPSRVLRACGHRPIGFSYIASRCLTFAPPLKHTCRMMPENQRILSLTPIAQVLAHVEALAQPVVPREAAVADAEGRILAVDANVTAARPATSVALIDGWAVRADTIADASSYAPVLLAAAPAWVDAGAALPRDADAVLPPDAVTIKAGGAEVHAAATAGDGVLGIGADALPDHPLRLAGERLRAADVAALQAAGIARVRVREPRVRVVSTAGAETDAVALAISRAASAHGIVVIFVRALERALADEQTDIVITIGGTGAGRNDHSVAMLRRMGEVHIHGFGIAPGESAALGSAKGHPVLMLPARLDAALAAFLIIGDALLRRLTGALTSEPAMPVILTRKINSTVGLADVVPVRRVAGGVEPLASGYWPAQALTRADGWVLVPPESEGFAAGTRLEMRAFP